MKNFFLVIIFLVATLAPGWALTHDGNKADVQNKEWRSATTTIGEKIYIRPVHIHPVTVVREDATTKKCPVKYKGQVENYQEKGYIVGDGKINPSQDRRPVSKWEQSLGIGRVVEKQKDRDFEQDQKISGKLDNSEFDEYTKDQSELDRDQNKAILANTRATRGVWYWVAAVIFIAGLSLTILFVALRWYVAAAVAGVICFIGLFALAIMNFGLVGIAIVALIGVVATVVILWFVYPSFQGSPVPIPPPAAAGGGYGPVSRPAVI